MKKTRDFEDTIDRTCIEILEKYFVGFQIGRDSPCWLTNPFLWAMFCAATDQEPGAHPQIGEPLTEFECLTYFVRGYAIVRLFHLMEERKASSVQ